MEAAIVIVFGALIAFAIYEHIDRRQPRVPARHCGTCGNELAVTHLEFAADGELYCNIECYLDRVGGPQILTPTVVRGKRATL